MAEKTRKQILLEKRNAIDEQIKKEAAKEKEAQRIKENREKAANRKKENKQKFLAGAAVLDEAREKPEYKTDLFRLLDRFLTKDYDRAFFVDWGLTPQHKSKIKPAPAGQENAPAPLETENAPTAHERETESA